MIYFVITFQHWNQTERRIIKTSEGNASKIHSELSTKLGEVLDDYLLIKRQQDDAWMSGDQEVFWGLNLELEKFHSNIKVLDFEVKFDDFISESWDGYNHFKIQTLTEWAEEQYLSENQK